MGFTILNPGLQAVCAISRCGRVSYCLVLQPFQAVKYLKGKTCILDRIDCFFYSSMIVHLSDEEQFWNASHIWLEGMWTGQEVSRVKIRQMSVWVCILNGMQRLPWETNKTITFIVNRIRHHRCFCNAQIAAISKKLFSCPCNFRSKILY